MRGHGQAAVHSPGSGKDVATDWQLGVIGSPGLHGAQARTSYHKHMRAPRAQPGRKGSKDSPPTGMALEGMMNSLEDCGARQADHLGHLGKRFEYQNP